MAQTARVLIVDDDPSLLNMLRILLETENYQITTARNGREALALLEEIPDLVLLDLQMPIMDGRAFYKEFRTRGFKAPVIVLSAFDADNAKNELGVDDSIAKPFDPFHVLSRVRNLLETPRSNTEACPGSNQDR